METVDFRTEYKHLYRASAKTPMLLEVPPLRFLMVHGVADPGGDTFQASMQALFSVAYTLKFSAKKELGLDYPVMPPEGLYWDPSGKPLLSEDQNRVMHWSLMSMVPEQITDDYLAKIRDDIKRKKGDEAPPVDEVLLEAYTEGTSVQLMHIGPYDAEMPTIERMGAFATEQGYEFWGKHHEIYIGDPRRGDPARLKTILRHPVRHIG